jgi:uncharacterized protein (TIGR02099 family)
MTYKWLRRGYLVIAFSLFIFAILLTLARILFVSVDDYKDHLTTWLSDEYRIDLSAKNISAGVDFDGIIITLDDIQLAKSNDLPFDVSSDYLFLHLNFWDSITEGQLNFNRISLQGVDLTIKNIQQASPNSEKSLLTLNSLENVFLQQLKQFSIKDSFVHFTTHTGIEKTVVIQNLNWLNDDTRHQGVGSALLPDRFGNNSLEFVINMSGEYANKSNPLLGKLYIDVKNINITDYLVDRVTANSQINEAVLGVQIWSEFSLTEIHQVQVVFNNSQLSWTHQGQREDWQLKSGLLQFTNHEQHWLFDSYNLAIEHNQKKVSDLNVAGHGDKYFAEFDFAGLYLKNLLPFYLLNANLSETQSTLIKDLHIDGELKNLSLRRNTDNHLIHFSTQLSAVNNKPKGRIPGISQANIELDGDLTQGVLNIRLPQQKIYFDQQFSRKMPVNEANIALDWSLSEQGLKISSDQSVLKTEDAEAITQFSLFIPNKTVTDQSPFLSLYSYVSLYDGSKAQYYYPIKVLHQKLFDYLRPTLKKGKIEGAKVLWYGALNQYPFSGNNGIFQAWVPLRDGQYDFYQKWPGLTNLDADLLFENDSLKVDARRAYLGDVKLTKLTARIDHLHPTGYLKINGSVNDDAKKITNYLNNTPLNTSVGQALKVLNVKKKVAGKLAITLPFIQSKKARKTQTEISLINNDIDVVITKDLVLPVKNAKGKLSFINGNLTAQKIDAQLFEQPLSFSASSIQKKRTYQVDIDINSIWDLQKLSASVPELSDLNLSGKLDWTGNVYFKHYMTGGYESRIAINSATQGVTSKLPVPFKKNALQAWPTSILLSSNDTSSTLKVNIKDKLDLVGQLDYNDKQVNIPYYAVNIGADELSYIDKNKHQLNIALYHLDMTDWYQLWNKLSVANYAQKSSSFPDMSLDNILVDVDHATIFNQPLAALNIQANKDNQLWHAKFDANNLKGNLEYRLGVPSRLDFDITNLDFKTMDLSLVKNKKNLTKQQRNLQNIYPEIMATCTNCHYGQVDLSPLKFHVYPDSKHINIDYLNIGTEEEFTNISGVWDQRRTSIIVNSVSNEKNDIVKRLGFSTPVVSEKGELNATLSWLGAPWQYNFESLNGQFTGGLSNGAVTEVDDKGARILSLLSLNAIRNTLNLEFDNIFEKGFNFEKLTLSGKITDGTIKNDDFYLDGSAGKIVGSGLLDLPNYETNYKFSYSPAVTSSLPVLTAFAINPLTGAAVLFLTKIFEPVVETIIRVDFSVHGSLTNPIVKLIGSEKGKVKLQNSAVLEEMNRLKAQKTED